MGIVSSQVLPKVTNTAGTQDFPQVIKLAPRAVKVARVNAKASQSGIYSFQTITEVTQLASKPHHQPTHLQSYTVSSQIRTGLSLIILTFVDPSHS